MTSRHRVSADKEAAAREAGDYLLSCLHVALEERDVATCALSGGSTPTLMFRYLAGRAFAWERVRFFWVDERCVPPAHAESNFGIAKREWLDRLSISASQIHHVEGEREPRDAADRYGCGVRAFFDLGEGEMPAFDVLHLGMGADGHTASLFPTGTLIQDRRSIAAAVYVASRSGTHRDR